MAKHTPGPWKLEGNWSLNSKKLGGWISTIHPSPLFSLEPITGTPENIIADAILLAAAPTMLAALKDARQKLEAQLGITYGAHFTMAEEIATLKTIRAAIAAAEPQP